MSTDLHVEVVPAALLAERAAIWVADRIWTAASDRGEAHVAVSGGSTPVALFHSLAMLHLPWDRVHIWQVDERVAPDGSADRNAGQLEAFRVAGAHVHLMPVASAPQGDLRIAADDYAVGMPDRFDVIHLGLGDDGHTASWPPGDPVVGAATAVAVVGSFNGRLRMTMTPQVVNRARDLMFLIAGSSKAAMLNRLYAADGSIPATAVRRSGTVVFTDVPTG